jgi:hypothetical protein
MSDALDEVVICICKKKFRFDFEKSKKGQRLAHREGRTRSLQIPGRDVTTHHKSLTLYPIELGGHLKMNRIRASRPCEHTHHGSKTNFVYAHLVRCTNRTLFVFVINESNVRGVRG